MERLKWTEEALLWLEDIHRYIAKDNPAAAVRVIEGILKKAELLTDFSEIGSRLRMVEEGDIRVTFYGHYRIVYLYRTGAGIVEILGVFHGALEISRYFP